VLGNLLALVALPFFPASRSLLGGAALVYALLVASSAIGAQGRPRPNPTLVALGIYLTHLTYGVGFLVGLSRAELDH